MALFICSNCGYGSASWMGRCPDCQNWNTFVERAEEKSIPVRSGLKNKKVEKLELTPLSNIKQVRKEKISTGLDEFDRVLAGGIVQGQVIFLTGEPGVGKSTLLLQALRKLKTIYISGEESADQVQDRAQRLKINLGSILYSNNLQVEAIVDAVSDRKDAVDMVVIDSIQTLSSLEFNKPAGSINQLKIVTSKLTKMAKSLDIPVVIIGHITKGGAIAGPKTLEHLVDCVLVFEGEKTSNHRILRATKNRFGNIEEIGIFEMRNTGLFQVNDPAAFLESSDEQAIGKTIAGVSEGRRILFFEIQALASYSNMTYPRRVVKGVDYNKLLLILAVLKKQLNIPVDRYDVYVNVVSGVSIKSTAADLGIAASLISSIRNVQIPKNTIFTGEVGLLGEIRKTSQEDKIVKEAHRLKFKSVINSDNARKIRDLKNILF